MYAFILKIYLETLVENIVNFFIKHDKKNGGTPFTSFTKTTFSSYEQTLHFMFR